MRDPTRAMDVHGLGPHSIREEWTLEMQLSGHGLEMADIPTVILTAPMGPKDLDIGGKDLFFDRKDVAGLVDDLWDSVDLIEGDMEILPGIHCIVYPNSHTPGSQCVYVETEDGMISIVGDMVRKGRAQCRPLHTAWALLRPGIDATGHRRHPGPFRSNLSGARS